MLLLVLFIIKSGASFQVKAVELFHSSAGETAENEKLKAIKE